MHNEFDWKIDYDAFILFVLNEKKKVSGICDNSFLKVRDVRTCESSLLNFSCESVEEISLIQSCRELNNISFEIRFID